MGIIKVVTLALPCRPLQGPSSSMKVKFYSKKKNSIKIKLTQPADLCNPQRNYEIQETQGVVLNLNCV